MIKELYLRDEYLCKICIADSFLKRFFGYMLRKDPHHEAIMITPCNSIHSFFMRFEIDVLFVDKDLVVVKKVEAMKLGKMIMPIKNAASVIETKAGGFANISIGDQLVIKANDCNSVHKFHKQ
jgi:uncharacterized protein